MKYSYDNSDYTISYNFDGDNNLNSLSFDDTIQTNSYDRLLRITSKNLNNDGGTYKTEFKYTNIVTTCDSMLNKFIYSTCNVYKEYPLISNPEYFDDKLGLLKNNLFLSKTRLFFISNKKINHLTFYLLLQKYSKEFIAEKILHIFNHENINKLTTYNTLKIKLKKI